MENAPLAEPLDHSSLRRRRQRRIAWIVVLLGASGLFLRWVVFREPEIPVTIFRVERGLVEATVANSRAGTVRSRRRATLSPEIGGRVIEVTVREGDRVRRDQVLVRLASDELRARFDFETRSLEAVRAGREEACRAADLARREHERSRDLARDKIVSADRLDQLESRAAMAESSCEAAGARVRQAEAGQTLARVGLDRTNVRAPFDGTVAEISAEVGEWITPSPPGVPIPPIAEIYDEKNIYVSAPLDEVDVGRVTKGRRVRVTLDAFPGRSLEGTLTKVAAYVLDVAEKNRTFEVEVELADQEFARQLLPGTSADVEVILDAREGALRTPSYAVTRSADGARSVLVVRDRRLESAPVKTGLENWAFVEIVEGLVIGDQVVTSLDRAEVKRGVRVRVEGETTK